MEWPVKPHAILRSLQRFATQDNYINFRKKIDLSPVILKQIRSDVFCKFCPDNYRDRLVDVFTEKDY
jgi:hypothetical protein